MLIIVLAKFFFFRKRVTKDGKVAQVIFQWYKQYAIKNYRCIKINLGFTNLEPKGSIAFRSVNSEQL
jgi:hypothetical protein